MNPVSQPSVLEQRASTPLMDVLIRIVLIGALAVLCYQIFSPFLTLTVWSIILAVTLYPLHQRLAGRLGRSRLPGIAGSLVERARVSRRQAPCPERPERWVE